MAVGEVVGVGVALWLLEGVTLGDAVGEVDGVGVNDAVGVAVVDGLLDGVGVTVPVGVGDDDGFGMQSVLNVDPVLVVVSSMSHRVQTVLPVPDAYAPIAHG